MGVKMLLAEAAPNTPRGAMTAYLELDWVEDQFRAIYDVLQQRGTVYVWLTGGLGVGGGSQFVQRPEDTLVAGAGNCVDASVLFAAALEAAGLHPVFRFAERHMVVGVRAAPDSDVVLAIETTALGDGVSFDEARARADAWWAERSQLSDPRLLEVDLREVRHDGVAPIPARIP